MHIRTAYVYDAAAIANVHVQSWRTTYKGIIPDAFLARLSYTQREQLWQQVLTDPGSQGYVFVQKMIVALSLGSYQVGQSAVET